LNGNQTGEPGIITSTTAADYVAASGGRCWFESGWDFQYGPDGEMIHGAHVGSAPSGTGWSDFDTSTVLGTPAEAEVSGVAGEDRIWVREELKAGYIPYSSPPGSLQDPDSAALYCHEDILNFDNYEFVFAPEAGETYHCVAFNALEDLWDGSDITVSGVCEDDTTTVFTITNVGTGDMAGPSEYRIYREGVLEDIQAFQLDAGDSMTVSVASGGDDMQIEVDQRPDHPTGTTAENEVLDCGSDEYQLGVSGVCIESDAIFTITNNDDEDIDTAYRVYRNGVLESTVPFSIDQGDTLEVTIFAGGDTIRLEVNIDDDDVWSAVVYSDVVECGGDENEPPVAEDDFDATEVNVPVTVDVLDNDYDLDGVLDPSTVNVTREAFNGTTGVNLTTGEITYSPALGYTGIDTFEYEVCDDDGLCDDALVTITIASFIPPVAEDDYETTDQDVPVTVDILFNDYDIDGFLEEDSVRETVPPDHGTTSVNLITGEMTYYPDPGYFGTDTFEYEVCDNDTLCDRAIVTIDIFALTPPVAEDDETSTEKNTPIDIDILWNDYDLDGVIVPSTVTITTPPGDGTITNIDSVTGEVTYLPDLDFLGVDTFEYEVCDDDGLCDTALVTVTVFELLPPVAGDDEETTGQNLPVDIDVLFNDYDLDGVIIPSTVTVTVPPANGSITNVNPINGEITYLPNPDYVGTDTFEYEVCDDDGLCDDAVVTVTIESLAPPVAEDDYEDTLEDTPVPVDVLDNDYDVDGVLVPSTVLVTSGPSNGSTSVNLITGVITYTPAPGYTGNDQFDYEVCDDDALCDDATVFIGIGTLIPPVAEDDAKSTRKNRPVTIALLFNDYDTDGVLEPGTTIVIDNPDNGTITSIDPLTGDAEYFGLDIPVIGK